MVDFKYLVIWFKGTMEQIAFIMIPVMFKKKEVSRKGLKNFLKVSRKAVLMNIWNMRAKKMDD